MENVMDREITLELNDMTGTYRGKTHEIFTSYTYPVYSYDQKHWLRIMDVKYDEAEKTFIFRKEFAKDKVWVAYAHPYLFKDLNNLIIAIEENKYVQVDYYGKTSQGNFIPKIEIKDREAKGEKKTAFIQALQHPGEDAGAYLIEGMIQYLLSADSMTSVILKDIVFVFVPMVNPDGCYVGNTRYSSLMGDLNNQWSTGDIEEEIEPEVKATQLLIKQLIDEDQLGLFIDIHCHGQKPGKNVIISRDDRVKPLSVVINDYWKIHYRTSGFNNSASSFVTKKYNIPAFTLELSQSYADNTKKYLTIYDYKRYGEDLAKAIHQYLK